MKKEFDIESVVVDLLEAVNLLKCFDEFCEESEVPTVKDKIEQRIAIACFLKRFKMHRSLLYVAIKSLTENIEQLDEYICTCLGKGDVA